MLKKNFDEGIRRAAERLAVLHRGRLQGLKVAHLTELRKRLVKAGAEVHVVKNSIFRVAAKEAGVGELNGSLAGQMAVVTGQEGHFRRREGAEKFCGGI